MNDRYKLRGKRVDNGEWVYGGFYQGIMSETNNPFSIDNARIKNIIITEGTYYHVDPKTVGQCTGLLVAKSYRGTKPDNLLIYEGDILKDKGGEEYKVEWGDEGAFYIICEDYLDTIYFTELEDFSYFEIIGNVHEVTNE